ncbi:MAG: hypothetical protein N4A53_12115 [Pelagimonas sp.]|nr:hypothetical protein [Pelagimonas sp.]
MPAAIAGDKAAQWEVGIGVLADRRNGTSVQALQQSLGGINLDRAVLALALDGGAGVQEPVQLGNAGELPAGIALQRIGYRAGGGFVAHQHPPMACDSLIAVAHGLAEHPIARLCAGFHLLHPLTAILLAFQLALRRHDCFDKFAFRCVFEPEVQTFGTRAPRIQFTAQLAVELSIAGKAFQIVKDDHVILEWLRIDVIEQVHHAWAVHKVAPARDIIGESRFYGIALCFGIGAAAGFLTFKAMPPRDLRHAGHTAIDDRWLR